MPEPPIFRTIKGHRYVRLPICTGRGKAITINPCVQGGQPCIEGTRIPAESIASTHAAGDSIEYITKAWDITVEDVQACIDYVEGYQQEDTHA
jgi:uncharacterized protein (DUF433 family)